MLPNLRLTIAAVFASILALCCGFAMFAAVRVSHAPLARASSATPGLQLTAANGPRLPLNLAAAEPFDHRFGLEQQARSGVRALAYAAPQPADAPVTQRTVPAAADAEQIASEPETPMNPPMNPPVAAPAPPAAEQAAPAQAAEIATILPPEAAGPTESETAPSPSRQAALAAPGTGPDIRPEQEAAAAPAIAPPPASTAGIKLPGAESPPEQGQAGGHSIEIASLPGNLAAESAMTMAPPPEKHADKKSRKTAARPRRYVRTPAFADDQGFGQTAVTAQPVRTRSRVTASPAANDWNSGSGGPYVAAPR
jgi:hypothetical protein